MIKNNSIQFRAKEFVQAIKHTKLKTKLASFTWYYFPEIQGIQIKTGQLYNIHNNVLLSYFCKAMLLPNVLLLSMSIEATAQ